ncbi:hypothetical protein BV898_04093 [Hypsibius exemplaris]|uniref:Chitin-binding type-2 domain-containing protein n=1 Tax=Hypsibius exemplaris TaxID=2072580 RepID=A0A1W0X322_HYPEX|nr:hypothetical protein BV898_04093 [Hypsibius exemplaris]
MAKLLSLGCFLLSYALSTDAQALQMDSPMASDAAPLETLQFRSGPPGNSSGLDGAASSGGYYYDKPRYKPAEYSYAPKYDSGSSYGSGYTTQSCYGQTPGMFGNPSYDCKSFSICQSDGRLDIMDCPAYTRFNNYLMVCDWPYKTDSYCNPIYKDEYYAPSYAKSYEKPTYYEKPAYYEKPSYYEKPAYVPPAYPPVPVYNSYEPKTYGYGYENKYESPSYGAGYKSSYPGYGNSYYTKKY